jgi:hypothetical protein
MQIAGEDPVLGWDGRAWPIGSGRGRGAILQPPKPEIRPANAVLEGAERVADAVGSEVAAMLIREWRHLGGAHSLVLRLKQVIDRGWAAREHASRLQDLEPVQ